jgi:hypothetical protein
VDSLECNSGRLSQELVADALLLMNDLVGHRSIPTRHASRLLVMIMILLVPACTEVTSSKTWHEKFKWQASEYFSTPLEIALCEAIETNDLPAIERLIKQGANVNAHGKGNMTPLLWAFPDNKVERFKLLLEKGFFRGISGYMKSE